MPTTCTNFCSVQTYCTRLLSFPFAFSYFLIVLSLLCDPYRGCLRFCGTRVGGLREYTSNSCTHRRASKLPSCYASASRITATDLCVCAGAGRYATEMEEDRRVRHLLHTSLSLFDRHAHLERHTRHQTSLSPYTTVSMSLDL